MRNCAAANYRSMYRYVPDYYLKADFKMSSQKSHNILLRFQPNLTCVKFTRYFVHRNSVSGTAPWYRNDLPVLFLSS